MEFFKELLATGVKNVSIEIKYADNDTATVMISPKTAATDAAFKNLKPLLISGSVEEIDDAFFNVVSKSLNKTQQMFNNIESYEAQQAEVNKATADKKAIEDKKKADIQALKKVTTDKAYDPVKDKEKVLKLVQAVFDLDKGNAYAEGIKKDVLLKASASIDLFATEE